MRIGITAELIGTMAGGMETYDFNLIHELTSIDTINEYCIYIGNCTRFGEFNPPPNFSIRHLGTSSRWVLIPFSLPWELWRRPVDIFHATFVPPLFCPSKLIFTVHDVACSVHPEFFPPLVRFRLSKLISMGVRKAVKIIAVSEATKRDIINTFGLDGRNIVVIHEGVNNRFRVIRDRMVVRQALQKYRIDSEYILYVGRFHVRKNLVRLLRAFDLMRKNANTGLKMVLVGRDLYHAYQVFREIEELKLEEEVICPGYIDERDLPLLYNGAKLFILPSIYEGFGLPPLEAMACGIPVIVSNCSSLPEVVGNAALLVNPYDTSEIAEKMYQLISDEHLRKTLIERGLSRVSLFTWEETAKKTLKIYEDAFWR